MRFSRTLQVTASFILLANAGMSYAGTAAEVTVSAETLLAQYQNAPETIENGRRIYGNPDARFVIHEYSDVECPWCRDYFPIPKQVADLSHGEIAVEWHHMPAPFHEPYATNEALALECLKEQKGNRAFWSGLNYLFETTQSNGKGSPELAKLHKIFDLDEERYVKCLTNPKQKELLKASFEKGLDEGINGTPSVIIEDRLTGNQSVLHGAHPIEDLMQALMEMKSQSTSQEG